MQKQGRKFVSSKSWGAYCLSLLLTMSRCQEKIRTIKRLNSRQKSFPSKVQAVYLA